VQYSPQTSARISNARGSNLDHKRKLQETTPEPVERAGWGALGNWKKFGSRAKRTLREFGAALDENYGKNSVFLTLTLPSTDREAFKALAEQTGYVCNRLTQWMRDNTENPVYAWCWEFQRRGALHLHLVVASYRDSDLDFLLNGWKGQVLDLLQQLEARSQCDLFTNTETGENHRSGLNLQADAQRTRKSAARYLAKYMGKHRSESNASNEFPPSSWWRVSNKGLALIRGLRRQLVVEADTSLNLDSLIAKLLRRTLLEPTRLFHYPNACMTFLDNWIVFSESREAGLTLFETYKAVVAEFAESQFSYGIANGGGGETSPREGAGNECGLSFSEIFTLMNSIRSTNLSTA